MLILTFSLWIDSFPVVGIKCRLLAALVMFGSDETILRPSTYDETDTLGC